MLEIQKQELEHKLQIIQQELVYLQKLIDLRNGALTAEERNSYTQRASNVCDNIEGACGLREGGELTLLQNEDQMSLRSKLMNRANHIRDNSAIGFTLLALAVRLPSGGIELITNYHDVGDVIDYYLSYYDDQLRHVHNDRVQIIDFMLI